MKQYVIFWTFIGNYGGPARTTAVNPFEAIKERFSYFNADGWKDKAVFHVFEVGNDLVFSGSFNDAKAADWT